MATNNSSLSVDEVAEFLDAYVSQPTVPKPPRRPAFVPPPPVHDALVLFVKTQTCECCGNQWAIPGYLGARRRIAAGFEYEPVTPGNRAYFSTLPRLVEHFDPETVYWCPGCFPAGTNGPAPLDKGEEVCQSVPPALLSCTGIV